MPQSSAFFDAFAGMLPEPMLLVSADATVQSSNAAFTASFGWSASDIAGRQLTDLADTPAEELVAYLRHCASTRQFVPGGFVLRRRDGAGVQVQAGGGVFAPAVDGLPARVVLRIIPKEQGSGRFVALSQKIDELTVEIGRRREAEATSAALLTGQHELREKLEILTEASGALFASPSVDDVIAAIGALAERLIHADAYALWRGDPGTGEWRVVWRRNLSSTFTDAIANTGASASPGQMVPAPLMVSDLERASMLAERRHAYAAEAIQALTIIPLRASGELQATVTAYFRRPMTFGDADRRLATALGNLGSSALQTALLYEEQARSRVEIERAGSRASFLARAGAILANSLDYEATLQSVANLAVPEIADWCAVDIVTAETELKRVAVAHADPAKVEFAKALRQQYPDDPDASAGIRDVIRRLQPALVEQVADDMLVAAARDERHLVLIRELGLSSYICVPLVAHGRALGALTFAYAESGRRYGPDDLAFLQELAVRAALAVENADAYEQVRRANGLKDEFLATLSHELRTPLNAVLGYTRMLRTGVLPEDKRPAALETVERNASSLNQLVEDVLDVSRIEAGKMRLHVQPVDLAAVVRSAVETVMPAAQARGVRVETILDEHIPPVSGDPERLQQVAWNLVSNAVKFTPRDGRVQVRVERVNSHVEVVVSDTGVGIAPDFLPHVFERFRQADGRFAREFGGLGLGLAITRHLIEMHGGRVVADSAGVGRGATFRVLLPLVIVHRRDVDAGPAGHPRGAELLRTETLSDLGGIRVLVVDDDADALELVRTVLESAGAQVAVATSGPSALAALDREVPDALVSDLGMPGMDGFELIAHVRALPDARRRNVPAAALTAYARSQDRTRALESGFHMHLAKPINPTELAAAVRALAQRNAAAM